MWTGARQYRVTDNSGQFYLFPPYLARHPEQAGWSQGQRLAFMRSEALRIIRSFRVVLAFVSLTTYRPIRHGRWAY